MRRDGTEAAGDPAVAREDLAQAVSEALGQSVEAAGIHAVGEEAEGIAVADSTSKFRVSFPDGTEGFAIVSGKVNPDIIQRGVDNIARARARLTAQVAAPILPVAASGRVKGLSFALWPFQQPLLAGGRMVRKWRQLRHGPRICDWHVALVRETAHPAPPERYHAALETIAEDPAFSDGIRTAAVRAQEHLRRAGSKPLHCLQHGDFWTGNILLPDARQTAPFFVIDWSGMTEEGYPLFDLCRMLMSLRSTPEFTSRQMAALQAQLGCDGDDLRMSVLSGLGDLGQNLEHFPPDRFRQMAEDVFLFADKALR